MTRARLPDLCKGFLIVLVVYGHALQFVVYDRSELVFSDPIFKAIYMFHMPMFMAISGYVAAYGAREKRWSTVTLRRLQDILLPMLLWCLVLTVIGLAIRAEVGEPALAPISTVKAYLASLAGSYWFLWGVFGGYVVVYALLALPISAAVSLPISIVLVWATPISHYTIVMFKYVYPFFVGGFLLHHYGLRARIGALGLLAAAVVYGGLFLAWSDTTYIYLNQFRIADGAGAAAIAVMFAGGVAGSVLLYGLLARLDGLPGDDRLRRGLAYLGTRTLEIYLVQGVVFQLWVWSGLSPTGIYGLDVALCLPAAIAVSVAIARLRDLTGRWPQPVPLLLWGGRSRVRQATPAGNATVATSRGD